MDPVTPTLLPLVRWLAVFSAVTLKHKQGKKSACFSLLNGLSTASVKLQKATPDVEYRNSGSAHNLPTSATFSCYLSPCFIVFNFSISSLTWSRFQSAILSVPDTSWTCSSVNPCFLRLAQNPCQLIGLSCLLYTSPSPRDS